MIRRPPRSTRTDTLFPTRRSSDLRAAGGEDRRVGGERLDMIGGAVDGVDAPHIARARIAFLVPAGGKIDRDPIGHQRSEEHTSELQSLMRISYAVFCLKKKNKKEYNSMQTTNDKKQTRNRL